MYYFIDTQLYSAHFAWLGYPHLANVRIGDVGVNLSKKSFFLSEFAASDRVAFDLLAVDAVDAVAAVALSPFPEIEPLCRVEQVHEMLKILFEHSQNR